MEVEFSPFISNNFKTNDRLYMLFFSSEVRSINNIPILSGLFDTKLSLFKEKIYLDLKSARAFQFLMVLSNGEKEWVSNVFFTGATFKQGPWVCAKLKQTKNDFEIKIDFKDHTEDRVNGNLETSSDIKIITPFPNRKILFRYPQITYGPV